MKILIGKTRCCIPSPRGLCGFTLIELLIVVAIIAILAAIAVPNFLEAQTRAKISRTKADMRAMDTALETYHLDNNAYPNCHRYGIVLAQPGEPKDRTILERISTPISYISTALAKDPFKITHRLARSTAAQQNTEIPTPVNAATDAAAKYNSYIYQSWNAHQRYAFPSDSYNMENRPKKSTAWLFHSAGPDGIYHNLGGVIDSDGPASLRHTVSFLYDATNGTISRGSIWRGGGQASASADSQAGTGLLAAIRIQP